MNELVSRLTAATLAAAVISAAFVTRAAGPTGRYIVSSGTVYDTKTKLAWQQAPAPSTSTQPNALAYCASLSLSGSGWRLPTMKELITIVDFSVTTTEPTINSTVFPGTPANYFWSSTSFAVNSGSAWVVLFANGPIFTNGVAASNSYNVRCVR
jgi:hypothetical protein